MKTEAIIIGAGPVGLTLALELARYGIKVRIIDKKSKPSKESRALGVMPRTLELLEKSSVAELIVQKGNPLQAIKIYDGHKRIVTMPVAKNTASIFSITILPQSDTERFMIKKLEELGVKVEWETELIALKQHDHQVSVTTKTISETYESKRYPWLLACDGVRSTVRSLLNIDFSIKKVEVPFLLADLEIIWDKPQNETISFLTPHGDMGVFPFVNKPLYRIVGPLFEDVKEEQVNMAFVEKFFRERCGFKAKLQNLKWTSVFNIESGILEHYRHGPIFFAGDAAHVHSPQGGQGMNAGIQDACNLAWKLALVHKGVINPDMLNTYQQERHPVALRIIRTAGGNTFITTLKNPLIRKIRNKIISAVFKLSQGIIVRSMANTNISYPSNKFVKNSSPLIKLPRISSPPKAGDRAPDVIYESGKLERQRLFDSFRSDKFILLYFKQQKSEVDLQPFNAYSENLETLIISRSYEPGDPTLVEDTNGKIFKRYRVRENTIYVIRPDGYIGFFNAPARIEKTMGYLSKLFILG